MNDTKNQLHYSHTRRAFLRTSTMGLGTMALSSLLNGDSFANASGSDGANPLRLRPGHSPAKAKAVRRN